MIIALQEAPTPFTDPFGSCANPARYVPRPATENALDALERATRPEGAVVLLVGPPGIGKTLLLRLLAQRLAPDIDSVHLPYASLPAGALFSWALDASGGRGATDPAGALIDRARERSAMGRGLALMVDDAESLPPATSLALQQLVAASLGTLRCVAAVNEDAVGNLGEPWTAATAVSICDPMSESETARYVSTHLRQERLPEPGVDAFAPDVVSELFARSEGVPSRVNAEASNVLRLAIGPRATVRAPEEPLDAPRAHSEVEARLEAHAETRSEPDAAARDELAAFARARRALIEQHVDEIPAVPPPPPRNDLRVPAMVGSVGVALVAVAFGVWLFASESAPPGKVVTFPKDSVGAKAEAPRMPGTAAPQEAPATAAVTATPDVTADGEALATLRESAPETPADLPATTIPVQINASPWARVVIDGEEAGITPLAGVMLSPGTHRFEAIFPDGRRSTRDIDIDAQHRYVVLR